MLAFASEVRGQLAASENGPTFMLPGMAHLAKGASRFTELDSWPELMNLTLELGRQAAGYHHAWIISSEGNEVLARQCSDPEAEQSLLYDLTSTDFQNSVWYRSFRVRLTEDTYCDAYFGCPLGNRPSAAIETERKQILQLLAALAGPKMSVAYDGSQQAFSNDVANEVARGAATQKMFFPPHAGIMGAFRFIGGSRIGKHMHGDFFDVMPLDEDRIAITLGDVCGKGVAASVIGTSIHSFLRAALPQSPSLPDTVSKLNEYLIPRRPEGSFATLFVAILNHRTLTMEYVDAGHGYGFLIGADKQLQRLDQGGGPPIGTFDGFSYEPVIIPLKTGDRVLVVSDGILEQQAKHVRKCFDIAGLQSVISSDSPATDLVVALFRAVEAFADTTPLADDATALLVEV